MECELCSAQEESYRLIETTTHAFSIICKEPLKPGHCMILPKRCVSELNELTDKESKEIFFLAESLRKKITKVYAEDPIVLINSGKHRTQKHLHIHIFPSKGSLRDLVSTFEKTPFRKVASNEELENIRDKILEQ